LLPRARKDYAQPREHDDIRWKQPPVPLNLQANPPSPFKPTLQANAVDLPSQAMASDFINSALAANSDQCHAEPRDGSMFVVLLTNMKPRP
jgi:hypothetical protein